jgi:hypothetical protein
VLDAIQQARFICYLTVEASFDGIKRIEPQTQKWYLPNMTHHDRMGPKLSAPVLSKKGVRSEF